MILTTDDLKNLGWAIARAEEWEGSMVGNPDTAPLERFQKRIKRAKYALKKLRFEHAIERKMLKQEEEMEKLNGEGDNDLPNVPVGNPGRELGESGQHEIAASADD